MNKQEFEKDMERIKLKDESFSKYFKLDDNKERTVFANVYALSLSKHDFEYGSRAFQVETVILDKVKNVLVLIPDNDGIDWFMDNYPDCDVLDIDEIKSEGTKVVDLMMEHYSIGYFYWGDFLNQTQEEFKS